MKTATKAPHGLEFGQEHWDSACDTMPQEYVDKIVAMTMPKNRKVRNWERLATGELLTKAENLHFIRTGEKPNRRPIYTLERFKREVLPEAVD